jgi:tetratricopeptide (TPR) repeat protein
MADRALLLVVFRSAVEMFRIVRAILRWPWRHPGRFAAIVALALIVSAFVLRGIAGAAFAEAERSLAADRPADANRQLAFARRVLWRSTDVLLLSARSARLIGDFPGAERHLYRTIELEGRTERVQLEFLLLRVQTGEVDQLSGPLIELAQKDHPATSLILESLARAYLVQLRYKPAYSCLSFWIEKRPDQAKAYQWRGWVLERLDNAPAARKDYDRALEINPDLVPVRLRIAEMHLEDKQAPKALPHLEHLLRIAPDDAQVRARLGTCLFLLGQFEPARRHMDVALEKLPNDPALLVALAELNLQENRIVDAESLLRRVLAADPSDTEALFKLAGLLSLDGRAAEAATAMAEYDRKKALVDRTNDLLQKIAQSKAPPPDDCAEVGRSLLEIGRERLGVYWCEQALEANPRHPVAHRALADHYEKTGDASRAAEHRRVLAGKS